MSNSLQEISNGSFLGCTRLAKLNLPNTLKSIGEGAFSDCISLTSVEIPNSVTEISSYAFYGCLELKKIKIPSSVTEIGDYAFGYTYNEYAQLQELISDVVIDAPVGSIGNIYAVNNKLKLARDVESNKLVYIIAVLVVIAIMAVVVIVIYIKKKSERELLGDIENNLILRKKIT